MGEYYNYCAICKRAVETYDNEDDGYEFHTRNRKVLIPHEDYHCINLPETKTFPILCIDCLNDSQKIKLYIKQARLEWYANQVKGFENKIINDKLLIEQSKKDIKRRTILIHQLMKLYEKIQCDKTVTGEDLTAELIE